MRGLFTVVVTLVLGCAMPAQGGGGGGGRGRVPRSEQSRAELQARLEQRLQEMEHRLAELRQQHGEDPRARPGREGEFRREPGAGRGGPGHRPMPPMMRRAMLREFRLRAQRGELRGPGSRRGPGGLGAPEGMRRPPFRMGPGMRRGFERGMERGMEPGMERGMERGDDAPRHRDGFERRPPPRDGEPRPLPRRRAPATESAPGEPARERAPGTSV